MTSEMDPFGKCHEIHDQLSSAKTREEAETLELAASCSQTVVLVGTHRDNRPRLLF